MLRKTTYGLLFLMLFSPLLSYLTVVSLELESSTLYFKLLVIVYIFFFLLFQKNIKIDKLLYFLIFYIIYLFIWSFFNGEMERMGLLRFVAYTDHFAILFIIIIIYNTHFSEKFINNTVFIFKITVILAAIASVIQIFDHSFLAAYDYYGKSDKMLDLNIYQFRRASIFGFINDNEVGLSFLPLLAVLIGLLLYKRRKNYIPFLLMGGVVAFLTNSRYVMIGFVIITLQILVVNKAKISNVFKYSLLAFVVFFILYLSLIYLGYNIQDWIDERLFAEGDITKITRYGAFINFGIFFPQTPVFGTGMYLIDEIRQASHAIGSSMIHVGYLSHLVSYGIVGSFFLFGFWLLLVKKLYKTAKLTNYWGSFFAFLIYLWAQTTFPNYSIFFYGLILALVFDKYYQDKLVLEKFTKKKQEYMYNKIT